MKRAVTVLIALVMWSLSWAQVSVRFGAGYSLPAMGQSMDLPGGYYNHFVFPSYDARYTADSSVIHSGKTSLGSGFNFNGAIDLDLTDHLAVEMAFGFLTGNTPGHTLINDYILLQTTNKYSYSVLIFDMTPSIILSTDIQGIETYTRLGIIFSTGIITANYVSYGAASRYEVQTKLSGNIALGLRGAAGAVYKISDNMGVFAEVYFTGQSYSPHKARIVKYTVNGADQLNNLDTEDKEFIFKRNFVSPTNHPADEPTILRKTSYSMGNIGLQIGLKLYF